MLPTKERTRGDVRARIELAEHMRVIRQVSGLSQKDVAARMGKTKSILTLLENTPNWRAKTFLRWAHALDVRVTFEVVNLPPLDTSDGYVAASLERQPLHPLGDDALALFLLERHINQQARAQGKVLLICTNDTMISDLQSAVRRLGGVLKVNLSRAT